MDGSIVRPGGSPSSCGATASTCLAAGPDLGAVEKQSLNWTAIVMFLMFVLGTLGIT